MTDPSERTEDDVMYEWGTWRIGEDEYDIEDEWDDAYSE